MAASSAFSEQFVELCHRFAIRPNPHVQQSEVLDGTCDGADVVQLVRTGKTPCVLAAFVIGFNPQTPQNDAGRVIEPPV